MIIKRNIIYAVLFLSTQVFSQDINVFFEKTDAFLKTYVSNGKVAYADIHSDPEGLNALMDLAGTISVSKEAPDVYQAFWINAYNLSVIKGIIDNYPTKSPLDIAGFFDKVTFKLAGKDVTLNAIEHKVLRAQFNDARFHFVLVCGAIGCPPLINEAYYPDKLEEQLDRQTRLALNGDYFIRVNTRKKRIEGSEILKWYKEDFTMNGQTEIDFINIYRKDKIPSNYKLSYFTYNWKLNSDQ